MAVRATIEYRGLLARGYGSHALSAIFMVAVKMALRDAGEKWQKEMLPRHFEFSAHQRYGYKKRQVGYEIRKARRYGHRRPLEYSGDSKKQILGEPRSVQVRREGDDFVVRVPISAPKHFWQINPRGQQIDKGAELTATNEEEIRAIRDFIDERIGVHLDRLSAGARRRRTVA